MYRFPVQQPGLPGTALSAPLRGLVVPAVLIVLMALGLPLKAAAAVGGELAGAQAGSAATMQLLAPTPAPAPAPVSVSGYAPPAPVGLAATGLGEAAGPALLAQARGGSDLTVNDTRLNGVTAQNSASHVVSGANIIQASSFSDVAGIPIVIQNSGANVLIQNATVINLKFN